MLFLPSVHIFSVCSPCQLWARVHFLLEKLFICVSRETSLNQTPVSGGLRPARLLKRAGGSPRCCGAGSGRAVGAPIVLGGKGGVDRVRPPCSAGPRLSGSPPLPGLPGHRADGRPESLGWGWAAAWQRVGGRTSPAAVQPSGKVGGTKKKRKKKKGERREGRELLEGEGFPAVWGQRCGECAQGRGEAAWHQWVAGLPQQPKTCVCASGCCALHPTSCRCRWLRSATGGARDPRGASVPK